MPFRFGTRRSLGLPVGGGGGGPAVGTFAWNPSDAYGSSAVFSNNNKTVNEQNGIDYVSCRSTTDIAQSASRISITNPTTVELSFGLSLGSASFGGSNGMNSSAGTYFYNSSGSAYKNGSRIGSSPVGPSYGVGDIIDVWFDGSAVYWRKNGNIVYSTPRTAGEGGLLYPTISGFVFTATLMDN